MTAGAKKPAERIRKVSSRTRKKKKQAVPKATRDTPGVREKSVPVLAQGTRRKQIQQKEPNVMITSLKAKYMVQKETNFLPGKKWSNLRTRTLRKVQRNHRYFEKRGRGVKICHSYSMIIHFFLSLAYSIFNGTYRTDEFSGFKYFWAAQEPGMPKDN